MVTKKLLASRFHLAQPVGIVQQAQNAFGKKLPFQFLQDLALFNNGIFEHNFRGAAVFHGARIHDLVVSREVRLGNQEGGFSHAGNLVEAAGAAAADDEITDGIDIGNVVEVILSIIAGVEQRLFLAGERLLQARGGIGGGVIPV